MLEGIIAAFLAKYLGKYIEGLNKENLKLSLGSGDLVLENLELRKEVLDDLDLPIAVKAGILGRFSLSIPWKALKSKPAIIRLEKIFLIAGPKLPTEYDEAEERRMQNTKRKRVALAELFMDRSKAEEESVSQKADDSFAKRLSTQVINNLQIFVDIVHIRYEDPRANPLRPFVIGLTLEHLHAQSTNSSWEPSFIESEQQLIYKLVDLKNFSVYWNTNDKPLSFSSSAELKQRLEELLFRTDTPPPPHQYLLHPVCGTLKVVVNKSDIPDMEIPKYTLNFLFDRISFVWDEAQYRDLLELQDSFERYARGYKYRKFRGALNFAPTAKARWTFAIQSVLSDLKERRRRWSWEAIHSHQQMRTQYIELFRLSGIKKLSAEEEQQLNSLEDRLTYDEILLYRSLARAYLAKDKAYASEKKNAAPSRGFLAAWMPSWSSAQTNSEPELKLTPEVWKELYAAIDYNADNTKKFDVPKEYVKLLMTFTVNRGSYELRGDGRGIVSVGWYGFQFTLQHRETSDTFYAQLKSFEVTDDFTKNNKFRNVVAPIANDAVSGPWWSMRLDRNPSGTADYSLKMTMQALNIVYSKPCIDRIVVTLAVRFFDRPKVFVPEAPVSAMPQAEQLTAAQVLYAIGASTTVEVDVHLQAPNIIIPEELSDENSPRLVLVLGKLSITSDISDAAAIRSAGQLTPADLMNPDILYDRFTLQMNSLQALVITSDADLATWLLRPERSAEEERRLQLIERFDVKLTLQTCKIRADSLPKRKISGALPSLRFFLTTDKCIRLLRIFDRISTSPSPAQSAPAKDVPSGMGLQSQSQSPLWSSEDDDDGKGFPRVRRRVMEANFTFNELSVLFHQDNKDHVLLSMKELSMRYLKRPYDYEFFLTLHSLTAEDRLQEWGPDFRYLASTITATDNDLIRIRFCAVEKMSPEYGGVDFIFEYFFDGIHLVCNRETVVRLVTFFNDVGDALVKSRETSSPPATPIKSGGSADGLVSLPLPVPETSSGSLWGHTQLSIPMTPSDGKLLGSPATARRIRTNSALGTSDLAKKKCSRGKGQPTYLLRLHAEMKSLGVTLNQEGQRLAVLSFSHSAIDVSVANGTSAVEIKCKLGTMSVKDLTPEGAMWPQVVEIQGERMVDVHYQTLSPEQAARLGHEAILNLNMSSMRLVYQQRFIFALRRYFVEMEEMRSLLHVTASTAANLAKGAAEQLGTTNRKIRYTCNLYNPFVVMPRNFRSRELLEADLGRITIFNTFQMGEGEDVVERICVAIGALNLKAGRPGTPIFQQKILQDTNMELMFEMHSHDPTHEFPEIKISGDISDITILMTESQFHLLRGVMEENICAAKGPTEPSGGFEQTPPKPHSDLSQRKWTVLAYLINLSKFSLSLFMDQGLSEENHPQPLASLSANKLQTDYAIFSDDTMAGTFCLESVVLIDERPGANNQFPQLLSPRIPRERSATGPVQTQELTVKYMRTLDGHQEYSYFLDYPRIIWVPDAISQIKAFVFKMVEDAVDTWNKFKKWKNPLTPPPVTGTELRIKATITNPDICLLEKPNKRDTRALVFRSSIIINWISRDQTVKATYQMQNLVAYKCKLCEEESTISHIIEPMCLSVDQLTAPNMRRWKAEMEPMSVFISYADWNLTLAVINYWLKWLSSFNKGTPQEETDIHEELAITTNGVKLTLMNDLLGQSTPIANLNFTKLLISVKGWSSPPTTLFVSANVRGDYYNNRLEVWEPMVESWSFVVNWHRTRNSGLRASLLSTEKLKVNMTKALLESLLNAVETWNEQSIQSKRELRITMSQTPQREVYHPYYIRNETGQKLWYWQDNRRIHELRAEADEPIEFDSVPFFRLKDEHASGAAAARTLNVQIEGCQPVKNLPFDRVGAHVLPIGKDEELARDVVYEVMFRKGSKVLVFRSSVVIHNHTSTAIEILIKKGSDRGMLKSVDPNASISLPLEYATSNSSVQLRPAGMPYDWSSSLLLASLEKKAGLFCCQPEDKLAAPYAYAIQIDTPLIESGRRAEHRQSIISLYPPIIIENLLACAFEFRIYDQKTHQLISDLTQKVEMGKEVALHHIRLAHLAISVKLPGFLWSRPENINGYPADTIKVFDPKGRQLTLRVLNTVKPYGLRRVALFCEYWFINKVGLPLLYREDSFREGGKLAAGQEESEVRLKGDPREWYPQTEEKIEPFMFSYTTFGLRGNRVAVKVASSEWSRSVDLAAQGTIGGLSIPDTPRTGEPIRSFEIAISIDPAPDKYWRTKLVTVYPRYILVNNTEGTLLYNQKGSEQIFFLYPGARLPFHWPDIHRPFLLRIRPDGDEWNWSGAFRITEAGTVTLRMRSLEEGRPHIMARIQVKMDKATALVLISYESKEFPTYLIENRSSFSFTFFQKGTKGLEESVPPGGVRTFAWDEPGITPRRLLLLIEYSDIMLEVNLDKLKKYPIKGALRSKKVAFSVEVVAEGPTRVLRVSDGVLDINDFPLLSVQEERKTSRATVLTRLVQIEAEVIAHLDGLCLSIVDETPQELLFIFAEKMYFEYTNSNLSQTLEIIVHTVQVDNQLYTGVHPVVLFAPNQERPLFHLSMVKSNQYASIEYYDYFSILFQEIDLRFDEELLVRCIKFYNALTEYIHKRRKILHELRSEPGIAASDESQSKLLYFRTLHVNPIKANVSFATDALRDDKKEENVISNLIKTGGLLPNVENAPLILNGLLFKNPFLTREDLWDMMTKHYKSATIEQIYKVLGSTDILGNPISLLKNLGTGVYDFFHEPILGLITSPRDFGLGLAKGTSSLVKNSVYGSFNTISKITGSIGQGVAVLSFDSDYKRDREIIQREKPRHVAEGVAFGFRDLGIGLFRGLTGIIHAPIRGALEGGWEGFLKGISIGFQGTYIKPTVGVIDLVTRTAEGVRNTTVYFDEKDRHRKRAPRYFGPDRILQVYDPVKAEGQQYLYTVEDGKYRTDWYLFHEKLEGMVVVISDRRVIYIVVKSLREEWHVDLSDLHSMSIVEEGVALTLHRFTSSQMFENPTRRRIIYCPDSKWELYDRMFSVLKAQNYQDEAVPRLSRLRTTIN